MILLKFGIFISIIGSKRRGVIILHLVALRVGFIEGDILRSLSSIKN
jgi:hypothetical protein